MMSLAPGDRLGPYEIVGSLGSGGMGEVYRARDARLQRDVAIKVLPQSFANDPDRLARFSREAQVLASLNHPHIAQVYGIEETAATRSGEASLRGLVMELVEGSTLADRASPVPIDEALPIARQIADALAAAHDRGIVHRDLKPANIKLTPNGTVKVLDFGLAKALGQGMGSGSRGQGGIQEQGSDYGNSPTLTTPAMTQAGVIMGTAAYMSPEQARGKTVDHRADVWSFGVILYELLTGRSPFAAETISDTIAAVLTRQPDMRLLAPNTPLNVHHVIERCLRQDPQRRYHAIADARIDLEEQALPAAPRSRSTVGTLAALVAGLVVGAAILGSFWALRARAPVVRPVHNFTIPVAGFSSIGSTAISRDGKWIAYTPDVPAPPFPMFVRALDSFESRQLAAATNSTSLNPFFSPDAKWVAFFMDGALYKVPTTGGSPEPLAPLRSGVAQGSWLTDGTIVVSALFSVDNAQRRPLARVSAAGGSFTYLTKPVANESHTDPEALPDGRTVLFTVLTPQSSHIAAVSVDGGEQRIVISDARTPRYSATGHLLFQRPGSRDLMAVSFDPAQLTVTSEPVRITAVAQLIDSAAYGVADDGTLIYSGPTDTAEQSGFTIVAIDRSGAVTPVLQQPGTWAQPRVSPDGRSLVYRSIVAPNCDLWLLDISRGTRTRVTFDGDNHDPIWRADGQLTWSSVASGMRLIRSARPDRPAQVTTLSEGKYERIPESWSRDGKLLLFTELHPDTGLDLWVLSAETGEVHPIATSKFKEGPAAFSPNGQWIAYVTNESGRDEVYVQPVTSDGGRIVISSAGGRGPLWSPDGRELFYAEGSRLMVVAFDSRSASPEAGQPKQIVEGPFVWERFGNYDITPDGKRFVFVRRAQGPDQSATLRVVLNWPSQFIPSAAR